MAAVLSGFTRRAAGYVDRIFKGANPATCHRARNTFELAIKPQDRKALGLTIPQSLLLRADEVNPSMRTVVGSRAIGLSSPFRVEMGGKAVAQWSQDRRSGEAISCSRNGGLSVRMADPTARCPRRKRPPAIHSRTRRMMFVFDLERADRRGGRPISEPVMTDHGLPRARRTGTSAVEDRVSRALLTPSRAGRPATNSS